MGRTFCSNSYQYLCSNCRINEDMLQFEPKPDDEITFHAECYMALICFSLHVVVSNGHTAVWFGRQLPLLFRNLLSPPSRQHSECDAV